MAKSQEFSELLRGASINQLSQLFELDRRTVADRLRGVTPSGRRSTFPIYRIADVAELLVSGYMSEEQLTEAQKRQRADKEKDYWDARLKEQKFLENQGDLWRTDKVIEVLSTVFKEFREAMVQFVDKIEHESDLPTHLVNKTKSFSDGLLVELREKLVMMDTHEDDEDEEGFTGDDDDFDAALAEFGLDL